MADAKKAAKKAAPKNDTNVTDSQAEKAFAEPDKYEGVDQPAESLSPAESLQRDHDRADEQHALDKVRDDLNKDLKEKRDIIREQQDPGARYRAAAIVANIPVVDGDELVISSLDGRTYVEVGGKRAVLDREGAINAGQRISDAYQAS